MEFMGKVVTGKGKFGFIGIGTVRRIDGGPHGLGAQDIFVHSDDLGYEVATDLVVTFSVAPDKSRGGNAFRAIEVWEVNEGLALPVGSPAVPGFNTLALAQDTGYAVAMSYDRLPVHAAMKAVPKETVSRVIENAPLPRMSRIHEVPRSEEERQALLSWMLGMMFPLLRDFKAEYSVIEWSDAELDRVVAETARDYELVGLKSQIAVLNDEVARFKEVRAFFKMMTEEDLVRPDAIIPVKYLPDLFMAVPVWYFFMKDQQDIEKFAGEYKQNDPRVSAKVKFFCELAKNQQWYDTFQLFNRRVRPFSLYQGETVPPAVLKRMMRAAPLLDHVVIATPYHDQAGKEWTDPAWQRAIDPYVLGFKRGMPFFIVLGRYSDAGTFPLFNELVADTIEFLRQNRELLKQFKVTNPYWYQAAPDPRNAGRNGPDELDPRGQGGVLEFGPNALYPHVGEILRHFDAGTLFSWLRGEIGGVPVRA